MKMIVRKIAAVLLSATLLLSVAGCGGKVPVDISKAAAALPVSQQKSDVQTMLVISLTDYEISGNQKTLRNNRQADMMILMTIDKDAGTVSTSQIDPGAEVSFQPQGATKAVTMPIGEVYTYGSGGSDSNLNVLTAVSKLMGNVKIDHYMTFDAEAIGVMADMLGGVTVNVVDPFPEAYPELAKGGSVCLDGKTAEIFFNYIAPEDSDYAAHMRRQQEFIMSVYRLFSANVGKDEFVTKLSMKLGDKMNTDLTLSQMLEMMDAMQGYDLGDSIQTVK